jgi:hypothetical protein
MRLKTRVTQQEVTEWKERRANGESYHSIARTYGRHASTVMRVVKSDKNTVRPSGRELLDETVATPEEWESDPFGVASLIIREACERALSYEGAMNGTEQNMLRAIITLLR